MRWPRSIDDKDNDADFFTELGDKSSVRDSAVNDDVRAWKKVAAHKLYKVHTRPFARPPAPPARSAHAAYSQHRRCRMPPPPALLPRAARGSGLCAMQASGLGADATFTEVGSPPLKQSVLESTAVYVLPAASQVFVWIGRKVAKDLRSKAWETATVWPPTPVCPFPPRQDTQRCAVLTLPAPRRVRCCVGGRGRCPRRFWKPTTTRRTSQWRV